MTALTDPPSTRPTTAAQPKTSALVADAEIAAKAVENTLVIKISTPVWVVIAAIVISNVVGIAFHI